MLQIPVGPQGRRRVPSPSYRLPEKSSEDVTVEMDKVWFSTNNSLYKCLFALFHMTNDELLSCEEYAVIRWSQADGGAEQQWFLFFITVVYHTGCLSTDGFCLQGAPHAAGTAGSLLAHFLPENARRTQREGRRTLQGSRPIGIRVIHLPETKNGSDALSLTKANAPLSLHTCNMETEGYLKCSF